MLEQRFTTIDAAADEAAKYTRDLGTIVKGLRKASRTGDLNQVHRHLAELNDRLEDLGNISNNINDLDLDSYNSEFDSSFSIEQIENLIEQIELSGSLDDFNLDSYNSEFDSDWNDEEIEVLLELLIDGSDDSNSDSFDDNNELEELEEELDGSNEFDNSNEFEEVSI